MALGTYADLKASAANWLDRSDMTAVIVDAITLAEARLNRELGPVETDATLSGATGTRTIDISSLSMVRPVALFLSQTGYDESEIAPKADGNFTFRTADARPHMWAIDGTNIVFDCPLDQAYSFRFRYQQRFALSDSVTTNWLLTNHPDVYLAATLMWGAGYNEAWANGQVWKGLLDEAIPSIAHDLAQSRRGTLTIDPGLSRIGSRPIYSGTNLSLI